MDSSKYKWCAFVSEDGWKCPYADWREIHNTIVYFNTPLIETSDGLRPIHQFVEKKE